MSWLATPSAICSLSGDVGDRRRDRRRVTGRQEAAPSTLTARSRLPGRASGPPSPRPSPAPRHGHPPTRRARGAGVPANPTPILHVRVGEGDPSSTSIPSFQSSSIARKLEQTEGVTDQQRHAGTARVDELRRAGRKRNEGPIERHDRPPQLLSVELAEHVLEELLNGEHRAHERSRTRSAPASLASLTKRLAASATWRFVRRVGAGSGTRSSPRDGDDSRAQEPEVPTSGTGCELIDRTGAPATRTTGTGFCSGCPTGSLASFDVGSART